MWKPESGLTSNSSKKEGPKNKGYDFFSEEKTPFQKLGENLEDALRFDLPGTSIYDPDLVEKLESSRLPQERVRAIRDMLVQRAEMALEDDLNPLEACRLLPQLGMEDRLRERVKKSIRYGETSEGEICYDYFSKGFKYFDEEERVKYTDEYVEENGIRALAETEFFRAELDGFQAAYETYCVMWNLPHKGVGIEDINAAQELHHEGYDLTVGVMNSGVPISTLLELLGTPARYLEWHRNNWEGPPVWREIGQAIELPKKVRKILVTENDTQTGATLEAIIPTLEAFGAEVVDATFLYDQWKTNVDVVKKLPFYDEALQLDDIGKKGVYAKFMDAKKRLEAAIAGTNDVVE